LALHAALAEVAAADARALPHVRQSTQKSILTSGESDSFFHSFFQLLSFHRLLVHKRATAFSTAFSSCSLSFFQLLSFFSCSLKKAARFSCSLFSAAEKS
jgi:hypothetical protein